MHRQALLFAALTLLAAAPAHAVQLGQPQPGSVLPGANLKFSNTFYYKWNHFLDDNVDDDIDPSADYHEFVNRLRADLEIGKFSIGTQLDLVGIGPGCEDPAWAAKFEDGECEPPRTLRGSGGLGWEPDASPTFLPRLEKVWLKYRGKNVQFEIGDYYAAFGRGVILSMVKKPEIDQDSSLLGGRFDIQTKRFDFTALAGMTNPQEVSMELRNTSINRTPFSVIAGGQMKFRPVDGWEIGVHGAGYDLEVEEKKGAVGGYLEANNLAAGYLDLFIEGNALMSRQVQYGDGGEVLGSTLDPGWAFYGAATGYFGAVTLTLEGKSYRNARILQRAGPVVPLQYNLPPTLEHEASVTEAINNTIQSQDVHGWKLQADIWLLPTDTTLFASFANSFDGQRHPGFNEERQIMIHPQVGIDQPIHLAEGKSLHLAGDVGYRHDFPWQFDEGHDEHVPDQFLSNFGVLHFRADIGLTIGKHAFEIVSTYRRQHWTLEEEVCFESLGDAGYCDSDDGWVSVENAVSYTFMGKYTAALHVDFTDDPLVQNATTNGAPGNLHYDQGFKSSAYIGGEVILKPISNLEIAIFGGSQKAGIVCTGGACRTVPAFTGVKSKVTVNF